jgi:hypothetical protein
MPLAARCSCPAVAAPLAGTLRWWLVPALTLVVVTSSSKLAQPAVQRTRAGVFAFVVATTLDRQVPVVVVVVLSCALGLLAPLTSTVAAAHRLQVEKSQSLPLMRALRVQAVECLLAPALRLLGQAVRFRLKLVPRLVAMVVASPWLWVLAVQVKVVILP